MTFLFLLHHPITATNWQGTGNFDTSNLTDIWGFITSNLKNDNTGTLHNFNLAFSDHFNEVWAPAWNIVTVKNSIVDPTYNDVILYGYTFKNHWMWFNGYSDQAINYYKFSFVIWKDYNCQNWRSIGAGLTTEDRNSGFVVSKQIKIHGLISSIINGQMLLIDPWGQAKLFLEALQGDQDFVVADNHAYTIVMSQPTTSGATMYGRLCMVDRNFYYSQSDYNGVIVSESYNQYGSFMLFQTR